MTTLFRYSAVAILILSFAPAAPGQTDGTVTLKAIIHDYTGTSNAEHWTVAWVTTGSGTFVKTLWRQGPTITSSSWNSHCQQWYNAKGGSGGSTAFDGYSSATAPNYTGTVPSPGTNNPIDPVWNCRDGSGNLVADGSYKFYIQYAENAGQGPYTTTALNWTKGPNPFSQAYANQGTTGSPQGGNNFTDMSVTWTPLAPEIAVEQPAGADIADGGSKAFGSVTIGSHTVLTFTIKNTGNANLTGLTIDKGGTNPGEFTVTSNPVAPVGGPAGTANFTVQYAPTAAGERTAVLSIASNDADEHPFDLNLTGMAVTAYDEWAAASGLPADQRAASLTPQNDGISNLLKYAFNLDPLKPDVRQLRVAANDTAGLPGGALAGAKLRLEFLRRKSSTNPGITYTPQFAYNPGGTWTDFIGIPASVTSVDDTTWERVVVEDPSPAGAATRFARVKITQP